MLKYARKIKNMHKKDKQKKRFFKHFINTIKIFFLQFKIIIELNYKYLSTFLNFFFFFVGSFNL